MKPLKLLADARAAFDQDDTWVSALVLRRYENGRPESFRIDDSTAEFDVPGEFSHVLIVFETPLANLLARVAGDVGATSGNRNLLPDFPLTYVAAADSPVRGNTVG